MKKVSVVGLGKLGLPFAVCLAEAGFSVLGVDINERNIDSLNKGVSPLSETDLQKLISNNKPRLSFTSKHARAIRETDITFVVVATPSDKRGNFSNKYVESALGSLAAELRTSKKGNHTFVINSTLMPSSTEKRLIPLIEKSSGRELNRGFDVCYAPDFVALGSVIKDFINPDMVVIGESNKTAGDGVEAMYKKMCKNKPPIHRMSIINAELAKISLNMYVTTKISFANMLANICSRIDGADVDAVTNAIGSDKRISPHYLKGGLSFGGTCFPRDVKAFSTLAKKFGYTDDLVRAVDKVNRLQDDYLLRTVLGSLKKVKMKRVSVLGLSFKPGTPEIEKSPSITLIKNLLKNNIGVAAYDSLATENTKKIFGDKIEHTSSIKDCLSYSRVWVIATNDKKFKTIDRKYVGAKPAVIIDCWRVLDPLKLGKNVEHVALGKHQR